MKNGKVLRNAVIASVVMLSSIGLTGCGKKKKTPPPPPPLVESFTVNVTKANFGITLTSCNDGHIIQCSYLLNGAANATGGFSGSETTVCTPGKQMLVGQAVCDDAPPIDIYQFVPICIDITTGAPLIILNGDAGNSSCS